MSQYPFPMYDENFPGLMFCGSCACKHSCYGLMYAILLSCPAYNIFRALLYSPSSGSYVLPSSSPQISLSAEAMAGWYRCPIYSWPITVAYLQNFEQLWASALTITHCDKKKNQSGLRAAQICKYKHKCLEVILKTWPFRKAVTVGSPSKTYN